MKNFLIICLIIILILSIVDARNRASYRSANIKDKIWNLASKIENKDPNLYRKDPYGNIIHYNSYGNRNDKRGWEIDHIKPKSRGGSDDIINLQALNWYNNIKLSNSINKKNRHHK